MIFKSFEAQASRRILTLMMVGILIPTAVVQAQEKPVFKPDTPWSVGSTELSNVRGLKSMKLPCVVSNQFDNGFVIRFSGGGGSFLAMAVDFRQDVFKQGRQYETLVSVGDAYAKQVSATAFTASTLIFNLRPVTDLYAAVQKGRTLGLDIDGNVMTFELGQMAPALAALEACYTGDQKAPVVEPMVNAAAVPVAAVEKDKVVAPNAAALPPAVAQKELPRTFDDIMKGAEKVETPAAPKAVAPVVDSAPKNTQMKTTAPVASTPSKVSRANVDAETLPPPVAPKTAPLKAELAPLPLAPAVTQIPVKEQTVPRPTMPQQNAPEVAAKVPPVWEAKAGEDLKIVLSRWSTIAGYDLQWQSGDDGKVAQDIRMSGPFDRAVAQLLAENSAATGIAAHLQTPDGYKKDLSLPKVPEPGLGPAPVKAAIPAMHDEWSAPAGANIQSVIDNWAQKAGVTVVWQSYMSIPLKASIQSNGSFESVLQGLLDQYANDSVRPVGQLNIDPKTGNRTLLMNLDKTSR